MASHSQEDGCPPHPPLRLISPPLFCLSNTRSLPGSQPAGTPASLLGAPFPGSRIRWLLIVQIDQFFESPLCANCWTLSATSIISLHHNNPVRDLRGPDSVKEPESEHSRSDGIPPVVLSPVHHASSQGPILRQGFLEEAAPPGTLRVGEGLGCRWLERGHCRLYVGGARGAGG